MYTTSTALDPLPATPDRAFMTSAPFSAQTSDQPSAGRFVLRMLGMFYHAGGKSSLMVSGAPTGASAFIAINGKMLPTGSFNEPEGNHLLDVRYDSDMQMQEFPGLRGAIHDPWTSAFSVAKLVKMLGMLRVGVVEA